jgi:membrane associated rhomboid family serine protease
MPLIPLYDANPRRYIRAHYVTIGLVVVNFGIFLTMLGMSDAEIFDTLLGFAVIPARLFEGFELPTGTDNVAPLLSLISYQFLHGGWQHVIFNMLFLWVFGANIEDAMGHARFLLFFLICGLMGGLVHGLVDTTSLTPVVGASGAISGVLGAYLMLYPRARLLVLLFAFIPIRLPALLVIGTFFVQDLLWAATNTPSALGVAVWVHIGGFITGAILVVGLKNPHVPLWARPTKP